MFFWSCGVLTVRKTGWTCGINYGYKITNVVELKYWQHAGFELVH